MKRTPGHTAALILVLLCFLVLGLMLSNPATCAWFLLAVFICMIPGWFACRLLYGSEYARRLESLGHTLILGLLLTTFLSILIAAIGPGLTVSVMLIAALSASLLLFLLGHWAKTPLSTLRDDDPVKTRFAMVIGLIMVLIIVVIPFLNVGKEVDDSYAYAPYFNRDFLRNLAFGATLSKGAIPPANPYFAGETLHYYWFQAVLPALVYRMSGRAVVLEDVFLLATLLVDIVFVFIFVSLLRQFVKRTPALIAVLVLAFVAESYQAPFKALLALQPNHWALEETWLGAIVLPPMGYFFQHLLYLPQHFVALTAFLIAVSLLLEEPSQNKVKKNLAAAIILMLSSGFSFFIISFGFLWAGSFLALQCLGDVVALLRRAKNYEAVRSCSSLIATVLSVVSIGGVGLVSYGLLGSLEMLLKGSEAFCIRVTKWHLLAPLHFFVMLGPMFLLGLAGLVVCIRDRTMFSRHWGLLWLLLSALFTVAFVVPVGISSPWEVSQKLGIVLRIPTLILSGIFFDHLLTRRLKLGRVVWAVLVLFCASAVPNLLAYEYVHWNVQNSVFVTYIGAAEKKAAVWIRQQTPLNAVVQAWPGGQTSVRPYSRPGEDAFSLVSVFGERQTIIGDPLFTRYFIPSWKYQEADERAAEISRIYEDPENSDVANVLRKFQIDYIYWGISERQCCLKSLAWYEKSSLFEKVYDEGGVSIFKFLGK